MKRILSAVLLAILFHVFLFTLDPGWFYRNKPGKIAKPAVVVTMSYKRKPELPPVTKTLPETKKKKNVQIIEKTKEPVPVRNIKKIPEPVKEQIVINEEIEEKETVEISEALINEEIEEVDEAIEETASAVITEAMPLYKMNPEPEYPRMAEKRRYEGTVILSVLVNKQGMVDNLWIFESSGYKILDNAALKAVRNWTFEPGKRGDEPMDMWVEVPVRFEIR